MVVEELRAKAKEKRAKLQEESRSQEVSRSLEYADIVIKLFSNVAYIEQASAGIVREALYFIGVAYDQVDPTYEELMYEINLSYKVVSPEQIAQWGKEEENNE